MAARPDERGAGIDRSLKIWEGARREQLRRGSDLSLEEILRAQEEMAQLARRLAPGTSDEGARRCA
jgi:hypothetical protein